MISLQGALRRVDSFQQRHPAVAFPFAVSKKFGDDQGGSLAALIAYYGFFSMFPLLLVLVSGLGIVMSGHPALRDRVVHTALAQFPVIGPQIVAGSKVHAIQGSWVTLAVGLVGALWAGLGVAQAAQTAMNTVWNVPRSSWPNFLLSRLRALAMLVVLGSVLAASTLAGGVGGSGALPSGILNVAGWVVSALLNFALFLLAYRILTAKDVRWREVAPGAAAAAVAWSALQIVGGYYLTHQVRSASELYGTFALVIGILVWIALGAQIVIYGAEVNVVASNHLWPRSLVQPPLGKADRAVYRSIVERARMRGEMDVDVSFPGNEPGGASRQR